MALKELITLSKVDVDLKTFFHAFYPDDKTIIYFRTFDDKKRGKSGHKYCVELRFIDSILPKLKKDNGDGFCVAFIPNGGGQTDAEVIASKSCVVHYMEIDDLPMEEQLKLINEFPLKPSIIIKTKKSLHCYWLIKNGDIKRFRPIQKGLITYFHSDSSIINESKAMRVPCFYHCKGEPVRVEVIHFEPELRYTQDELEAVLPEVKEDDAPRESIVTGEQTIPLHHRVNTLISMIGTCKAKGLTDEVIKNLVKDMNYRMCNPPLSEEQLVKEVYPAIYRFPTMSLLTRSYNPVLLKKLTALTPNMRYKWNDRGNGQLFADCFNNMLKWNTSMEKWMFFDGKRWSVDEGGMRASNLGKQLYDALLVYAGNNIEDEDIKSKYVKHIGGLGERHERENMLKDARDFYCIDSNMLDRDAYLLNCQNSTINSKKRELTAHDPEQLLSKICNAKYDPSIRSNLWEWFVSDIMYGDVEKIEYLQKIAGTLLVGTCPEEEMYIFHGLSTRNGKTTFTETLAYMLGNDTGYALKVDPKSFGFSRNLNVNQARGDIARLKGCRLAYTSEPDKQLTFDAGLLKQLTGQNVISARFNYGEVIQFEPSFKIIIDCNNLPMITDSTLFDSDRIRVIPFDRHVPEEERDKTLKERLREPENMSGILNWCLDGLDMYYRDGLKPPKCVIDATREYQQVSDKLGAFIAECLEATGKNSTGKSVYQAYQCWCRDNHIELEQKGAFFAELRARGMMAESATVNGMTVKNAVIGYSVITE